ADAAGVCGQPGSGVRAVWHSVVRILHAATGRAAGEPDVLYAGTRPARSLTRRGRARSRRTRPDPRPLDGLNDCVADRTQKHAGESATSVTPDDDKLGGLRRVHERMRCSVTDEAILHRHVGIALLPT